MIEMLDDLYIRDQKAVVIEMGERQARELAEELNASMPVFDSVLMKRFGVEHAEPKRITWNDVVAGNGFLFDAPIRGVESPDYLRVIAVNRRDLA